MNITQVSPDVIVGLEAEIPLPAAMPIGTIFVATDTIRSFVLISNEATGVRFWQILSATGPVFKFSGCHTTIDIEPPRATFWFSDALAGDPIHLHETGLISPVNYYVLTASSRQVLGVVSLFNGLIFDASVGIYRNGLLVGGVTVPAGSTGTHAASLSGAFAAGDTLSLGLTCDLSEPLGTTISFTAVVALNP